MVETRTDLRRFKKFGRVAAPESGPWLKRLVPVDGLVERLRRRVSLLPMVMLQRVASIGGQLADQPPNPLAGLAFRTTVEPSLNFPTHPVPEPQVGVPGLTPVARPVASMVATFTSLDFQATI
jgi:hypothetical protein